MRVSTVRHGRMGAIGQDLCPSGYYFDESAQTCLPSDLGVPTPPPPVVPFTDLTDLAGSLPTVPTGTTVQTSPTLQLPISLPPLFAPAGVTPAPGSLQTPGSVCPPGFTQSGGVCVSVPSTSLIPGISNTVLFGAGALLLVMSMMRKR